MFTQDNTSFIIIVHQMTCKVSTIDNSYIVIKEWHYFLLTFLFHM
jgi:hypothetical protein